MISQNNQRIAELSSENIGILSADLFPDTSGTLTDEQIQEIKEIADKDVVLFLQSDNEYVYTPTFKIKTNDYSVFEFIQPIPENSQGSTLTLIEISTSYVDKTYHIAVSEYRIITNGDGTKFLANDGRYKEIDNVFIIDDNIVIAEGGTNSISEQNYNSIINAIKENKVIIYKDNGQNYISSSYLSDGDTYADIRFYGLQEPIIVTDSQYQTIYVVTIHLDKATLTSTVKFFDFDFKNDILTKTNTTEYTPTTDYNPATKKYVDDNFFVTAENTGNITMFGGRFDYTYRIIKLPNMLIFTTSFNLGDNHIGDYSITSYSSEASISGEGEITINGSNLTIGNVTYDYLEFTLKVDYILNTFETPNTAYINGTRYSNLNCILTETEYTKLGDSVDSNVLYFITED